MLRIKFSGGRQFSSPKSPTSCSCKTLPVSGGRIPQGQKLGSIKTKMRTLLFSLTIISILSSCKPSVGDKVIQIYFRDIPSRTWSSVKAIDTTWMKTEIVLVFNDSAAIQIPDERPTSDINIILDEILGKKYDEIWNDGMMKYFAKNSGDFILKEKQYGQYNAIYECSYDGTTNLLFTRHSVIQPPDTNTFYNAPASDSLGVNTYKTILSHTKANSLKFPESTFNPKTSLVVPLRLVPIDENYQNEIDKLITFKYDRTNDDEVKKRYNKNKFVLAYFIAMVINGKQLSQQVKIVDDSLHLLFEYDSENPIKYYRHLKLNQREKDSLVNDKRLTQFVSTRSDSIPVPIGNSAAGLHLLYSKVNGKYTFGGILEPLNIPRRMLNLYGEEKIRKTCFEQTSTLKNVNINELGRLLRIFTARDSLFNELKKRL